VGNCGISLAPLLPDGDPPRPLGLVGDRPDFRFLRFGDYLDALDAAPLAVNAVCLVGHTTLRAGAMERLDRPATADEIRAMAGRLEAALEAGAAGLSSGVYYDTARAAPTSELVELAHVVGRYGGLYAAHVRDEGDGVLEAMAEAFTVGRVAGIPVVLSHHKVMGRPNYGRSRETLSLIDEVSRSQPVGIDTYPYVAGATELRMDAVEASGRVLITFSRAAPEATGRDLAFCRRVEVPWKRPAASRQAPLLTWTEMSASWPGRTMIGSDSIGWSITRACGGAVCARARSLLPGGGSVRL
jgi:N-acyl-D-amino-acid deacylase